MEKIKFKNLLIYMLAFLLMTWVYVLTTFAQSQEWIQSDKVDDIETFYQIEKIGINKYEVKIKINNNRSKNVRVVIVVKYKVKNNGREYSSNNECELIISSKSSCVCEDIEIPSEKIIGTKIIDWNNYNSKSKKNCTSLKKEVNNIP